MVPVQVDLAAVASEYNISYAAVQHRMTRLRAFMNQLDTETSDSTDDNVAATDTTTDAAHADSDVQASPKWRWTLLATLEGGR